MRELLVALNLLRLKTRDARKSCDCPVCLPPDRAAAARAVAAVMAADAAAPGTDAPTTVDVLPEEKTPYYFMSKAGNCMHYYSKAMLCPKKRHKVLELRENDDAEQFWIYNKECSYGDCDCCGVDHRTLRCPYEDKDDVKVKLFEYRLQPRTVKGTDDEGNPTSKTAAVNELTEVEVTGKELHDKIEAHAPRYFKHCWNCIWTKQVRILDMHTSG